MPSRGDRDVRFGSKADIRTEKAMSALPPKVNICNALAHVSFGPEADMHVYPSETNLQRREGVEQRNIRNPHQAVERLVQL